MGVPCPICGKNVDRLIGGMCADCYRERNKLVEFKKFKALICGECGAVLIKGRWVKPRGGPRGLLEKLLKEHMVVRGHLDNVDVRVSIMEDALEYHVSVRGSIEPMSTHYEETQSVSVPLTIDLCPDCRANQAKREMGMVQVRGFLKPLSRSALRKVMLIIDSVVRDSSAKNVGSIIDVEEVAGGIDVKTTTNRLARIIASEIHRNVPSRMLETQKDTGYDRSGRRTYRYTASVLVVPFEPDDVLRVDGRYYVVERVGRRGVRLRDVASGNVFEVPINRFTRMNVIETGMRAEIGEVIEVDGAPHLVSGGKDMGPVDTELRGRVKYVRLEDKVYIVAAA